MASAKLVGMHHCRGRQRKIGSHTALYFGALERIVEMPNGTVKWFNGEKGYGFIQPDSGGQDVFVHVSALEQAGIRNLAEGQKVSYEVVSDKRTGKASAGNLQL